MSFSVGVTIKGLPKLTAVVQRLSRESRFVWPNELMDQAADIMVESIQDEISSDSGEMAESVEWEASPDKRTVTVGVEYGRYQEFGTKESPGRYVPEIGKRLKSDPRHLALKQAKRFGYEPEFPDILEYKERDVPYLEITPAGKIWGRFWYPTQKTEARIEVAADRGRRKASRGRRLLATRIHEYLHAIQWTAMGHQMTTYKSLEKEAYAAGRLAFKIGMHPGVPATFFFKNGIAKANDKIRELLREYIGARFSGIVWATR